MTATQLREGLASAHAGDLLELDGQSYLLWSACGAPADVLVCLPCHQRLANQAQIEMHLESDRPHAIAALCATHGWEALS